MTKSDLFLKLMIFFKMDIFLTSFYSIIFLRKKKGLKMTKKLTTLSIVASAFLTLTSIPLVAENLIQNGSFEDYKINTNHGVWKEVTFNNWRGTGESWNSGIGKPATDGIHKIELDVGRELNELSQIISTVEGEKYKLSLDAYARRGGTSNFQILVDGEVLATFIPDSQWAEYKVYFIGIGSEQVISIKELDNQNNGLGAIIDNVHVETSQEMIKNGSFEAYTINSNHGIWKEVTFDGWEGDGEVWNNRIGKRSTNGAKKIELDVGRELNSLTQTVTTEERKEYALSLDAYARVTNSSDFEIWIDDTKIQTVTPTAEWKNYSFTFFGNGKAQKIQIKELDSQNNSLGAVIDNVSLVPTGNFDNRPPVIEGVAKTMTPLYNSYTFIPNSTDIDGDNMTFTIENKPEWAEFNSSTGVLTGVPTVIGVTSDIKIIATDGRLTSALPPFSIEVTKAVDIAQKYGTATQPPKDGYYWYSSPDKMIDGDDTTSNHTEGVSTKNWVQIEIPHSTKVHQVMVQSRSSNSWRTDGARVYISETPYNGTLNEADYIGTLKGNDTKQYIDLDEAKLGNYLIIKGKDDRHIHLVTVEIYGEMPSAPMFTSSDYNLTIGKWQNKIESIFNVQATDYQEDSLSYSIEGDVPFTIDANGDIRVDDILTAESYTFDVVVSDGLNHTKQSMVVHIADKTFVKRVARSNDSTPELSGFVPNTYNDGDILTVTIAGVSYEAVVKSDGTWRVDNDSIENPLAVGTYDIKVSINGGEAIVYEDYFEVYSSMLQTATYSLAMETIATVPVTITAHTETPLKKDERVRGSSVWLKVENGVVTLNNKSYREIKSLLGKYKDANGKDILVKLDFNQDILPYSSNILENFDHASEMTIVHTAGHFDTELSFGAKSGVDCDANTPTDKTLYCTPTTRNDEIYSERSAQNSTDLSEQQVYSVAMATYNHLYNSIDGLNAMKAWVEGATYKGLDYRGDYQSSKDYLEFVDDKMAYLNEKYFRVTMPNNHIKFSSMRYRYAAEGMGGGVSGDLLGTKSGGTFASIWEGSIKFDNHRLLTYDTTHHEAMHGIGFGHGSGMTYGWSYALRQVVDKFYTVGENPIVDVPNYIFETKILNENQLQLTLYKTAEATSDEVTFEILSGTPVMDNEYTIEQTDNDENNQVTLTMNKALLTRFFIRAYGTDSDEIMSKMITPREMTRTYLATDRNASKSYHLISHASWEKGAKALNLSLKTNDARPICKLLVGGDANIAYEVDAKKINSDFRTKMDAMDWIESKKFLGRKGVWYQYLAYDYSDGDYTTEWKNYNTLVNDDTLGILCVKPVK
jgi:hypothetical protein